MRVQCLVEQNSGAGSGKDLPMKLLDVLCEFNNCGPVMLEKKLKREKYRNLDFIKCFAPLSCNHLKNRQQLVYPDQISVLGADQLFALRGYLDIRVDQYYYVKHKKKLKYPKLPCIVEYGGNNHCSFYPIEVLEL
jgi:hypothetical protein